MILASTGEERMRSSRPKPVHMLCGRPMMQYVVDALDPSEVDRIVVVVGEGAEQVSKKITETAADPRIVFAEHATARGDAESALAGLEVFADDFGEDDMLVLGGNTPLLRAETVSGLLAHHRGSGAAATVLAVPASPSDPFGRVVEGKDAGSVASVESVLDGEDEHRLADGGIYCFRRSLLAPAIRRLRPSPVTGRFSLSDVIDVLTSAGHLATAYEASQSLDVQPVDDRIQLATAEAAVRARTNLFWMKQGVTMVDPDRTYIDTTVRLAPDVTLFPGTMLQGVSVVGPGAEIGPDTRLVDCAVGARSRVEKTMGREAEIGEEAAVGPFAVLEPGSQVPPAAVTGPFYHAHE